MSMSIDYGKLDRVYAFADFLEVLSNPDALKRTVDEYKVQADALKELIEKKTAVAEVDGYVARQKKELEELLAFHEGEVAKSNELLKTKKAMLDTKQAEIDELHRQAETAKAAAVASEATAVAHEADAVRIRDLAKVQLEALIKERKEVAAERQALDEKHEQLRKALGA